MRKAFMFAVIVEALLVGAGWTQGLPDQLNFLNSNTEGFHFYGVSAFYAYSTYDFLPRPITTRVDTRSQYGAGGTVGWQHFRSKLGASVRYSANYDGTVQQSSLNRVNQALVLNLVRPIGVKWSVSLSFSGRDMSLSQTLFEPTSLGSISQSASSFNDLSAALSVGQFSSPQSAVMAGAAAGDLSPTTSALLGSRVLSYAAHLSANYDISSRLSFQIGSFAVGGQRRSGNVLGVSNNYIVPNTLGGTASLSMSYALSPRTTLGLGVGQNYTRSRYQQATSTSTSASLGRKMGKNWFLTGNLGGSFNQNLNQSLGSTPQRQMTGGGSIGYRTQTHTFLARYVRSGFDAITAVTGANTNYAGAWSWRRPRSSWGFHASYTRNQTSNTGFSNLYGWQTRGGISHTLSHQMTLLIDTSYLDSHAIFQTVTNTVKVHSVRVSVGWTPGLTRRPSAPAAEEEVK